MNKLDSSWLDGHYGEDIEINTSLSYIAIGEFFAQGEEADSIIEEINDIYNNQDCTPEEAINLWASNNL